MKTQKHSKPQQQESTNGAIQQLISAYAQSAGVDPKAITQALQKMNPNQQQAALKKMQMAIQQNTQQAQPQQSQQQAPQQQDVQQPQMATGGSTNGQLMQIVQMYAQMTEQDPKKIMQKLQQMKPSDQQQLIQQMTQSVQGAQHQQGQEQEQPQMKSGGWLKGAVNPEHKGFCTPMTKDTCTPRRKAFAERAKHHTLEEGGEIEQAIQQFAAGGSYATSGVPTNGSLKVMMAATGVRNSNVGQYNPHIFDDKRDDAKLNPVADKINSTVSKVPDEDATIEAEKNEIIVKPDLGGIYKILGKTHAAGGVALNPESGSFIFSNDPKLAITKNEKNLFEFKDGGSTAKSKNTPSQVLGREVDLKEYNRYMSILQNPKAETIEKATAALMVDKYQKIMGQVAYLQEAKKNEQAPDFSEGTMPMTNPTIQKQQEEQQMYKYGGQLPKAQMGGNNWQLWPGDKLPAFQNKFGISNASSFTNNMDDISNQFGYTGPKDNQSFQHWLYNYSPQNKQIIDDLHNRYGMPANSPSNMFDGKLGIRWQQALLNIAGQKSTPQQPQNVWGNNMWMPPKQEQTGSCPEGYYFSSPEGKCVPNPTTPGPSKPVVPQAPTNSIPTLPYDIQGHLTPAQKADLTYRGLDAMSIKKYMPMRQQIDLPDVSLDKANLQPFLNNINNQNFQAYNSLNGMDPRNGKLAASNIYGKGADNVQQAIGQVQNQNVQIGNQENLTNMQRHDQTQEFNVGATGKYYDQTVAANQNFDDEKRYAKNQVMSTLNQYQSQDDAQAWALAAINKYGIRKVVDPKTGQTYNQPVPLYEPTRNGIRYNSDVASLSMATGAVKENSQAQDYEIMKQMREMGYSPKEIVYYIGQLKKSKTPQYNINPGMAQ